MRSLATHTTGREHAPRPKERTSREVVPSMVFNISRDPLGTRYSASFILRGTNRPGTGNFNGGNNLEETVAKIIAEISELVRDKRNGVQIVLKSSLNSVVPHIVGMPELLSNKELETIAQAIRASRSEMIVTVQKDPIRLHRETDRSHRKLVAPHPARVAAKKVRRP